MISRFFKKKDSRPLAEKTVKAEKPKPKTKTMPQKILTAEGWRRMMMRTKKNKRK